MSTFATKAELAEVARKLESDSAPSTFWRLVERFTKLGGAFAVGVALFGMLAVIVRYADKVGAIK